MRRIDVLRAPAHRPDLLTAPNALPLPDQLLVQVRVAQTAPVLVLDHDRVPKALGQVDRINHEAGSHRVYRRPMSIPAVDIDAAMALLVKGGISLVIEDLSVAERDAPAASGRNDDIRCRIGKNSACRLALCNRQ